MLFHGIVLLSTITIHLQKYNHNNGTQYITMFGPIRAFITTLLYKSSNEAKTSRHIVCYYYDCIFAIQCIVIVFNKTLLQNNVGMKAVGLSTIELIPSSVRRPITHVTSNNPTETHAGGTLNANIRWWH